MSTFIERLFVEQHELVEKVDKLAAFFETDLFKNLDETNKSLLEIQYAAMKTYEKCLQKRLQLLTADIDLG